jgi:methionyl aminopeptidase
MTILREIIDNLASRVIEGATGNDLERYAELLMQIHEVEPAFKGYQPKGFSGAYPNILCVSINGEVIHGLPDDRKFEDGDVVKIDCGTKDRSHGQYDDGATTVIVGRGSAAARRLVKGTREALEAAVALAKPGVTTDDLAAAIEAVAKRYELAVIHGYGGHGIGTELHMEPFIPNEVVEGVPSVELVAGQRIAIEPMLSTNKGITQVAANGWTVKLIGGGIAAHFERTTFIE